MNPVPPTRLGDAGEAAHVLGRWNIVVRDMSVPLLDVALEEGTTAGATVAADLDRLRASGTEGAEHAAVVEAADLAVVVRGAGGEILQFACVALGDLDWPDIGERIGVRPGEAFIYHQHTVRRARGRRLAQAGLVVLLRTLEERGVDRVLAHVSQDNAIAMSYAGKLGFVVAGELSLVLSAGEFHWITVAARSFLAAAPTASAPGVEVHRAALEEWRRTTRDLDDLVSRLADDGAKVALFGSGVAAAQLLALVPALGPLVVTVVDNDERLHGRPSPVLPGLEVGPPAEWASGGATHLLYASRAHQGAMEEEHRARGPAGTIGIRVHPEVAVVAV